MRQISRWLTFVFVLAATATSVQSLAWSQDAKERSKSLNEPAKKQASEKDDADAKGFVLTDDVREALLPLFKRVNSAKVTRTTVEMLNDSLVAGREVDRRVGVFQIASQAPNKFTIYLKEPERRTRLYCDGKTLTAAVAPDAYVDLGDAVDLQSVVTDVPVIMGAYPEPVLALSVAGVDPAISFLGGMESLVILDRETFGEGKIPAIHLLGTQADGVTWDLWIRSDDQPQPLRMLVDLTPMLLQSRKVKVPGGYSQQIRYDFLSYRTTGTVDDSLFNYVIKPEATQFDSIDAYYDQESRAVAEHPMTGEAAPAFRASNLRGQIVDTRTLRGRVLVVDFWASWCKPCLEALPVIRDVCDEFKDQPVKLLSINTGEPRKEVGQFVRRQRMSADSLLDEQGKIADGFKADRIPQTVVIGRDGKIFRVLEGFSDPKDAGDRLRSTIELALAAEPNGSKKKAR